MFSGISAGISMSRNVFLENLLRTFANLEDCGVDLSDSSLVGRWFNGAAPISPKITAFYIQRGINWLADDIQDFILPLFPDRFLKTLKEDTLLIFDNFNELEDDFLGDILQYRCQVLFTTRNRYPEEAELEVTEIENASVLYELFSTFYADADEETALSIIHAVHAHTFLVELAARLLRQGLMTPDELLTHLNEEGAGLTAEEYIIATKDKQRRKRTYREHIRCLFELYYKRQEKIGAALHEIETAIEILRKYHLIDGHDSMVQLSSYAELCIHAGETARGIKILSQMSEYYRQNHLELCGDYAYIHEYLALAYSHLNDAERTIRHCSEAWRVYQQVWSDRTELLKMKHGSMVELCKTVMEKSNTNTPELLTKMLREYAETI